MRSMFVLGLLLAAATNLTAKPLVKDFTANWRHLRDAKPFDLHFLHTPSESPFAQEETQHLLNVVSDPEGGIVHQLLVAVDEQGSLVALIRKTGDEQQTILEADLFQKETVLARAAGRDAVLIRCHGTPQQGGKIVIKYLYDGLLNTYREQEAELRKMETGTWQLQTSTETLIHQLTLRSRKIFGRLIGIARIDIN